MYGPDQENIYYYITLMNETYHQPAMPEGAEDGIRRGIYKLLSNDGDKGKVRELAGKLANDCHREHRVKADLSPLFAQAYAAELCALGHVAGVCT